MTRSAEMGTAMAKALGLCCVLAFAQVGCTSEPKASGGTSYNVDNSTVPSEGVADAGDEAAAPPDGAAACPIGDCNYQTQRGCSEPDAGSCLPALRPSTASVEPTCIQAGALAEGSGCSHWSDCGHGLVCAEGVCRRLCCGRDWSACSSDERCVAPLSFTTDAAELPTGAYVCVPAHACDALTGAPCAAGTVCQIVDPTGATACVTAPAAGAGAAPGDPCPCQAGLTCVSQACRRLCGTTGTSAACPPEEGRCVHHARNPEGVGECTPVN